MDSRSPSPPSHPCALPHAVCVLEVELDCNLSMCAIVPVARALDPFSFRLNVVVHTCSHSQCRQRHQMSSGHPQLPSEFGDNLIVTLFGEQFSAAHCS